MNQRIRITIIFSLCLLSITLITMVTNSATASSGRTTYEGSVGGTAVTAQKDVVKSGDSWNGYIWSHTKNHSSIGTIGWTWWAIKETCSGSTLSNYSYGGHALYNASAVSDIAVDSISTCAYPSNHYGRVRGTHDFKHGSDTWRPYWEHSEKLN